MLSATSGGSSVANDSKQLTTGTLPETQTHQCREKKNNKGEPKTQDCLNARLSKGVHGETIALALPCVAGESSSSMPSLVTRIILVPNVCGWPQEYDPDVLLPLLVQCRVGSLVGSLAEIYTDPDTPLLSYDFTV